MSAATATRSENPMALRVRRMSAATEAFRGFPVSAADSLAAYELLERLEAEAKRPYEVGSLAVSVAACPLLELDTRVAADGGSGVTLDAAVHRGCEKQTKAFPDKRWHWKSGEATHAAHLAVGMHAAWGTEAPPRIAFFERLVETLADGGHSR